MKELNFLREKVFESDRFRKSLKCEKVEGLTGSLKAFFITCLLKKKKKICVVTREPEKLAQDIRMWMEVMTSPLESGKWEVKSENDRIFCISGWNEGVDAPVEIKAERLTGLSALLRW